jgi:hypothetical protein
MVKLKQPTKKEITDNVSDLLRKGPRTRPVKTYGDLVKNLETLKVSPQQAMRIINDLMASFNQPGSNRLNWKMIRFTLFIWERVREYENKYLKPKIDTIRKVVSRREFKDFFEAYFPDLEFNEEQEIHRLNKLIAEEPQQVYFKEGYYKYQGTNKIIEQSILDRILSNKY